MKGEAAGPGNSWVRKKWQATAWVFSHVNGKKSLVSWQVMVSSDGGRVESPPTKWKTSTSPILFAKAPSALANQPFYSLFHGPSPTLLGGLQNWHIRGKVLRREFWCLVYLERYIFSSTQMEYLMESMEIVSEQSDQGRSSRGSGAVKIHSENPALPLALMRPQNGIENPTSMVNFVFNCW